MINDEIFMLRAIELSRLAVEHNNEPFGAVLVKDGKIVYTCENQIYTKNDPTFHAETGLLRNFCKDTGKTDLSEYTLYSSCEPCFMCSGAMVWLRLGRLVYGASNEDLSEILNEKGSKCSSLVFDNSPFHRPSVTDGVLRNEAKQVLADYFKSHTKN